MPRKDNNNVFGPVAILLLILALVGFIGGLLDGWTG